MEQRQEGSLGQHRTHIAKRSLGHIVVEHQRRNVRERLDGRRGAIRCGHAVDDLGDTLLEMRHELDIEAAQRSLEHAGVGNDVCGLTASELAHGKCDLFSSRHLASDELLKRQVHMHARRDGINADLGARAMTALALERNAKTKHARERWASVEHQAKRRLAVDVHGEGSLGTRVLEQTIGDGGTGALKGLFTRLEQQLNRGVGLYELGLAAFKQTSRTKQRRRMHIVTACVHAAVGGGKRLARFFRNG